MILFGEGHLRRALDEYLVHYNAERNHQGIGNELIEGGAANDSGVIECTERLGGLLEFYRRAA
jgi:hypothetical protein